MSLWAASLVVVAMATLGFAQNRLPQPQMLSGNDIGFRVEGTDMTGKPTGVFVLRYNGNWIEVGSSATVRPVKK
jgi:hypothetical protein